MAFVGDDNDEVVELLVDWRLLVLGRHGQFRNSPHDRVVTGGNDDALSRALWNLGSEEAKVLRLEGIIVGAHSYSGKERNGSEASKG